MNVPALLFQRNATVTLAESGTEQAKIIKDLFIKFKITKSTKSTANKSIIEIYNLNQDSRGFIESFTSRKEIVKPKVKLNVGYQDLSELLFIGDITLTSSHKNGPDWITTITADTGKDAVEDTKFKKTYKAGTSENIIVEDVLNEVQLLSENIKAELKGEKINQSVTVNGSIKKLLDEYIGNQEKEWSVQDDGVQVLDGNQTTNEPAITLSKATGLIGSPIKTDTGIKLKALIQPGFKPGRGISVSSSLITGFYKIEKVTFDGQTRSNQWYAMIEASLTAANPVVGAPVETESESSFA